MKEDPLRGKPLQLALKGLRSWRTGDFRIVYRIVQDRLEILVVALGHRREVYERLRDRWKAE
jgi:mRNA interferase RelE/StbE